MTAEALLGAASVATAFAAFAALAFDGSYFDRAGIQERLVGAGVPEADAGERADTSVRSRKLALLALPLVLALGLTVAALIVLENDDDATTAAGTATASRCAAALAGNGQAGAENTSAGRTTVKLTPAELRIRLREAAQRGQRAERRRRQAGRRGQGRRAERRRTRKAPAAVTIVPVNGQGKPVEGLVALRVPFDNGRDVALRRQTVAVTGARVRDVRVAAINDLADPTTGRIMQTANGQLQAVVRPNAASSRHADVIVCLDPLVPAEMLPGTYAGTVLVSARRATAPVPIGLTITARDDRWWLAVLAALLGLVAGTFVRIGADKRWGPVVVDLEYVRNFRFWVMIGGGVAAAVYSYLTIYANDPVFDASAGNLWRITLETFAGTLASKAATDLIPPTEKERKGNKARMLKPKPSQ